MISNRANPGTWSYDDRDPPPSSLTEVDIVDAHAAHPITWG